MSGRSTTTTRSIQVPVFAISFILIIAGFAFNANAFFVLDKNKRIERALGKAYVHGTGARPNPRTFNRYVQNSPIWVTTHGLNADARTVLSLLEESYEHGIAPERYDVDGLMDQADRAYGNPKALAELEEDITDVVVRYVMDMRLGATNIKRHDKLGITQQEISRDDIVREIRAQRNIYRWLESLEPRSTVYKDLQRSLKRYTHLNQHGGWPRFPKGKAIKPGDEDMRLAILNKLLVRTGDMETFHHTKVYDETLQEAVKRFQARHGLNQDAVIGGGTQTALATSVEERIDQIRLTMERIRQLPDSLGNKYIMVNIPAFQLVAYEQGRRALEMDVIVGKPDRKTPIFSNTIQNTVFNPRWNVPVSIARRDILRKARKDPNYLVKGKFKVTVDGESVDPMSIDWQSVDRSNFPYRFQQAAGNRNALGKIKFTLPDNQSVYLHDTSDRKLFAKDFRALSSGCIRVSEPLTLAQFIMSEVEGWNSDKIERTFHSTRPAHVKVPPLPVHTVYWTAWTDGNGKLHFRNDVYKKDKITLADLGPYKAPIFWQIASR